MTEQTEYILNTDNTNTHNHSTNKLGKKKTKGSSGFTNF